MLLNGWQGLNAGTTLTIIGHHHGPISPIPIAVCDSLNCNHSFYKSLVGNIIGTHVALYLHYYNIRIWWVPKLYCTYIIKHCTLYQHNNQEHQAVQFLKKRFRVSFRPIPNDDANESFLNHFIIMKDSFCPQIRFFCKTEFSFCADFFLWPFRIRETRQRRIQFPPLSKICLLSNFKSRFVFCFLI